MIINVSGYGSTGASALIDLLKEFESIQYYKNSMEFQIIQQPDGLQDLYEGVYSGNRIKNQVSIKRFIDNINNTRNCSLANVTGNEFYQISLDFIDGLQLVKWQGKSNYDPKDIQHFFQKNVGQYFLLAFKILYKIANKRFIYKGDRYFVTASKEKFIEESREYLKKILKASGFDLSKPIVLEQALPCENPNRGQQFFDSKVISFIVDRDPRDVYIITNFLFPELNAYMPNDKNVENFVEYYRAMHKRVKKCDDVIYLNYEDLLFKYDETVEHIVSILGCPHINYGKYFKPEYSINNAMLYNDHPELTKDIHFIESELSEYLYPFEKMYYNKHVVKVKPFEHQEDNP